MVLNLVGRALNKVPLMRLLYTATKDLLSAFLGDKRSFEKPVLVTLLPGTNVNPVRNGEPLNPTLSKNEESIPQKTGLSNGVKVIGFITKESLASWGMVNEVMAFIISGGVSGIKR